MKYLSGSGLSYFYRKLMKELSNKAPQAHNHDDRYYTETEIDNKITSTVKTITLLASGWQGNQYTINDSLVTLTSNQRVMRALTMSEEQTNAYYEAKLSEVGQSNGQMVIKASGTVPTIDIPIRVMFSMTLIESPRATDTVTLATRNDTGDSIKFGIDKDGNYGYIKAGADSVVPFSRGVNGVGCSLKSGSSQESNILDSMNKTVKYILTQSTFVNGNAYSNAKVLGSNDKTSWYEVRSLGGGANSANSVMSTTNAYKYYKCTCSASGPEYNRACSACVFIEE